MKWWWLGLCFWVAPAWAGWSLDPAVIEPGGIVAVRHVGDGASAAVDIVFRDQAIPLLPVGSEVRALLGIDLLLEPGSYPVTIRNGVETLVLPLLVSRSTAPVERLTLPRRKAAPTDARTQRRVEDEQQRLTRLFAEVSPVVAWQRFALPNAAPFGSRFGVRRIINGVERAPHAGIDFRADAGAPVTASASGTVVLAGNLFYTGHTVILDHGGGLFSLYAHLRQIDAILGAHLRAGERVGAVGSSGRSTGPHLHWGARLHGARINPLLLLDLPYREKD